jgi:MoaA/NifB/PqqE/SkfB family radical SAM enzyme
MKQEYIRLYNRAKLLYHILAIKTFNKDYYPFYVNLVINSKCNLKCAYCFGDYHNRNTPDLKYEDFKKLVFELKQKGTKYILIQGGEPLLHPDLGRFIRFLYDNKILCAIVSNGQLPERLKELPHLNLMDNICFSIDGRPENNDKIRGQGSFNKVVESIEIVKKFFDVPVRISSSIHKLVKNDYKFMADFIKKNNLEWGINFLFKGDEKYNNIELGLNKQETIEYLDNLIELKKQGYPIFITKKILEYAKNWPVSYENKFLSLSECNKLNFKNKIECQYGNYEIVIDEDGKLYPCQALQNKFNGLSIYEHGFDKAFDNLRNKPCYTCYIPSMINTSAMINRDFNVLFETIFETFRNRFFR